MKNMHLFLKPDEANFLGMAIVRVIEDLQVTSKNINYNWTPQTRKTIKEMLEAGTSLRIKLKKLGWEIPDLPDYKEGDENEFLTKQS